MYISSIRLLDTSLHTRFISSFSSCSWFYQLYSHSVIPCSFVLFICPAVCSYLFFFSPTVSSSVSCPLVNRLLQLKDLLSSACPSVLYVYSLISLNVLLFILPFFFSIPFFMFLPRIQQSMLPTSPKTLSIREVKMSRHFHIEFSHICTFKLLLYMLNLFELMLNTKLLNYM